MKMGESAKDRRVLVREAGFKPTSLISALAGMLAAFGLVLVAGAVAGAIASGVGVNTETVTDHEWRTAGIIGAAIGVAVLFGAFFFGGYTAGRMSRRMGFRHGVLVFVCSAVVIAAVAGLAALTGAWTDLREHMSSIGVPTNRSTWSDIGIAAALASAAVMLVGSMVGGIRGDRWHTRLTVSAAERSRARAEQAEAPPDQRRPRYALGEDETSIDLRDRTEATTPSVEDERENARAGRADVGL